MNRRTHLFICIVLAAVVIVLTYIYLPNSASSSFPTGADAVAAEQPEIFPYEIKSNSTLYNALRDLGVAPQTIHQIVSAAKGTVDLGRLRPGTRFQLYHSAANDLLGIKFRFSAVDKLYIYKNAEAELNAAGTSAGPTALWRVEQIKEPVETRIATFSGVVRDTLWTSAENAKMDPILISELSEIFAWQVDFAREVRVNDRWRLSVEQNFVKGEPIGWGPILAAEYQNGDQLYTAFLFRQDGEVKGYFAADGTSLRRMFLKSPIQFTRISSRFSKNRLHPILDIKRPHLGVDYAAKKGTPVRAVGDGVVTMANWSGGGGNVIKIRHNSAYQTAYKHLSGYAKGIRPGVRVKQGQVIGYVGSTGLSTAPHLHFEFFHNGNYVDPLGRKFPSADPVAPEHLEQFQADAAVLKQSLPPWETLDQLTHAEMEDGAAAKELSSSASPEAIN